MTIDKKTILWALGGLVAVLLIFRAGMLVGFHEASFSYRFGERYYQSFGGMMHGGNWRGLREEFGNTFGTNGKIIKIALPKIVIEDQDGTEKIVAIDDGTTTSAVIRRQRDSIKPSDLKVGDNVVVLGLPDQNSEIDAKLIRVMPAVSTN